MGVRQCIAINEEKATAEGALGSTPGSRQVRLNRFGLR